MPRPCGGRRARPPGRSVPRRTASPASPGASAGPSAALPLTLPLPCSRTGGRRDGVDDGRFTPPRVNRRSRAPWLRPFARYRAAPRRGFPLPRPDVRLPDERPRLRPHGRGAAGRGQHGRDLAPLKRSRPDLVVAVAGCVAQQEGEKLLERVRHIDLVVGPDNIAELPALVMDQLGGAPPVALVTTMKGCDESPGCGGSMRRARLCAAGGAAIHEERREPRESFRRRPGPSYGCLAVRNLEDSSPEFASWLSALAGGFRRWSSMP